MQTSNKMVAIHKLQVTDVDETFVLNTEVTRVERGNLLRLPNPKYKEVVKQFDHLKGVKMEDTDDKEELPIHLILGASDYAKIKTPTQPRVGESGEPVGELTKFGWTIMSPGVMMMTLQNCCLLSRQCRTTSGYVIWTSLVFKSRSMENNQFTRSSRNSYVRAKMAGMKLVCFGNRKQVNYPAMNAEVEQD